MHERTNNRKFLNRIARTHFLHLPVLCFDFAPSDQLLIVNHAHVRTTYTHEIFDNSFLFFSSIPFLFEAIVVTIFFVVVVYSLLPCYLFLIPYDFFLRSDIMCASVAAGAHPFTEIKRTETFRISVLW